MNGQHREICAVTPSVLAVFLFSVVGMTFLPSSAALARSLAQAPPKSLTPAQMLWRYFADINGYRYHAAYLLEAPCRVGFKVPNGPGAPVGSASYGGRGVWSKGAVWDYYSGVSSARVTSIKRLHIPILDRNHILAFAVRGWFTFDYSKDRWANMKHKNGFHIVKIGMWKCHGRWGIEPEWSVGSGGELNWV